MLGRLPHAFSSETVMIQKFFENFKTENPLRMTLLYGERKVGELSMHAKRGVKFSLPRIYPRGVSNERSQTVFTEQSCKRRCGGLEGSLS